MSSTVPQVFVTGVTGYVGGDALSILVAAHPTWSYTFLVRDPSRVSSLVAQYPSTPIRVVTGSLSDTALLTTESSVASIVLHFASSDDMAAIHAIVTGLGSSSTANNPKYLIHTSGTGNLVHEDMNAGRFGQPGTKVWDDVADLAKIHAWPDTVLHHDVERVVFEAEERYPDLKTAIVCPPTIVGEGRGPGNTRSLQAPALVELIRKRGRGFRTGEGKASWSFVHVHDLSDVYLRLTEAAATGGGKVDWGHDGFYFVDNGEREWGPVAERITKRLFEKGVIESAEVDRLSQEEANELHFVVSATMGVNSRCRGTRTRKVLGWGPKLEDHEKELDELVDMELERGEGRLVELAKGHGPGPPNGTATW